MSELLRVSNQGSLMCPVCNKEVTLHEPGYYNCERYVVSNLVTASCGHAFQVSASVVLHASLYQGDRQTDGWGNPIKTAR